MNYKEKTLVVLKPDTIQRNLVGEIMKRFENRGLKIVGLKMIVATEEMVFSHYNKDDAWFIRKGEGAIKDIEAAGGVAEKEAIEYGKDIVRGLARYMTAGPSIAIVYEGHRAVDVVLSMVGKTEPVSVDAGTIRGDFGIDSYALCALQK
jgi:nucleoside-diphosphate kinase